MTISSLKKAISLLDARERQNALKLLTVMIIGAFASAIMVGSLFPFLSVLANPGLIRENAALSWLYHVGNFNTDYDFLVALGLTAIAIILLSNLILILQTWAVTRYTQMRVHSFSRRLLGHYFAQPYESFLERHSGDMTTNILSEAQLFVQNFLRPLFDLISASLTVLAVVTMLLVVEPFVASVTICIFATIYGIVAVSTRRYVRRIGQCRATANALRFRVASDALNGIKDVKLLGLESAYLERFSGPSVQVAEAQIGVTLFSDGPRYAIQIVAFGGLITLCLLLLDREAFATRGSLNDILPVLGMLAFAAQRLIPELQKLYQSLTMMTSSTAALDRVYNDLSQGSQARVDQTIPSPLGLLRALELDGINYAYPGAESAGLRDVHLTIRAGERIGVVGSSGAGKTTLADVILGLLPPKSGTIRADETLITSETLRAWQQTVGYVPQDIFLTDASLSENIALGLRREEIDETKVESAARIARLHDFAMTELPNGYATLIGERGVRLSGGQRQRIGIARALYHNAALIVFDEATSALDNQTEKDVMDAISQLPGDTTVLIIAHRLSTVRDCDRIIVMDKGRMVGMGTWGELEQDNPYFRKILIVADQS